MQHHLVRVCVLNFFRILPTLSSGREKRQISHSTKAERLSPGGRPLLDLCKNHAPEACTVFFCLTKV